MVKGIRKEFVIVHTIKAASSSCAYRQFFEAFKVFTQAFHLLGDFECQKNYISRLRLLRKVSNRKVLKF